MYQQCCCLHIYFLSPFISQCLPQTCVPIPYRKIMKRFPMLWRPKRDFENHARLSTATIRNMIRRFKALRKIIFDLLIMLYFLNCRDIPAPIQNDATQGVSVQITREHENTHCTSMYSWSRTCSNVSGKISILHFSFFTSYFSAERTSPPRFVEWTDKSEIGFKANDETAKVTLKCVAEGQPAPT